MKCPFCNKDIMIQIGTRINCNGCKILTNMTSVISVQCENCQHILQVPVQSKSFFSVKEEK